MGSNQNANSSFACLHWQHCQDRMRRPNHISVSKIETMMMTVDITDCESCPDFFLLWRGEGREQKKDNSIRGYPFVKYGACAKYSLFPTKKSKSQPSLLLSKMFNIATFFFRFFFPVLFSVFMSNARKNSCEACESVQPDANLWFHSCSRKPFLLLQEGR